MAKGELQKAPGHHLPERIDTSVKGYNTSKNFDKFPSSKEDSTHGAPHRLTSQNARGIGVG